MTQDVRGEPDGPDDARLADARLADAIRLLRAPVDTDADAFDARVLEQTQVGQHRSGVRRAWVTAAALAACLVIGIIGIFGIGLRHELRSSTEHVAAAHPAPAGTRVIRFQLADARARSVAVAGSFNAWSPDATPLHRAPDGTWSTKVPLTPGRHVYQFVVNHSQWIPDPRAPRDPADDFGTPNSVITVLRPGSGS